MSGIPLAFTFPFVLAALAGLRSGVSSATAVPPRCTRPGESNSNHHRKLPWPGSAALPQSQARLVKGKAKVKFAIKVGQISEVFEESLRFAC